MVETDPTETTRYLAYIKKYEKHARRWRRLMRLLPRDPRCKVCHTPFAGTGLVLRHFGYRRSRMNPRMCAKCLEASPAGGFDTECGVLFADIRGFTSLSETLPPAEVAALVNRFYAAATRVLIDRDAIVDKLVGDEVMGLFWPLMMGHDPCEEMAAAGEELLLAVEGQLPVGVGIHFGSAYMGNVGTSEIRDFTAIGDVVNVAARLQASAGPGEMVISDWVYASVRERYPDAVPTELQLKGKSAPFRAWVVRVGAQAPAARPSAAAST